MSNAKDLAKNYPYADLDGNNSFSGTNEFAGTSTFSGDGVFQGANDFTGMPTVGGDPVVESGSNSDGNWTRWADGTQYCYSTGVTFVYATDNYMDYNWNFPAEMLSGELSSGCAINYVSGNITSVNANQIGGIRSNSEHSVGTPYRLLVNTTGTAFSTSAQITGCQVWAAGRWK